MSNKLTAPLQIVLAGVIATGANVVAFPPHAYAKPDSAEFTREMRIHRSLVKIVGLFIFGEKPSLFARLDEQMVNDYLDLHDLPKILPLETLQLFEAGQSESIAERLVQFYGKRRENMSQEEFLSLMQTTTDLNRIEDSIKNHFFKRREVRSQQKAELVFLEDLADFAVTELTRQQELPGFNAVTILEQKGDTQEAGLLAEMLPQIKRYLESRKDCQALLAGEESA